MRHKQILACMTAGLLVRIDSQFGTKARVLRPHTYRRRGLLRPTRGFYVQIHEGEHTGKKIFLANSKIIEELAAYAVDNTGEDGA